MKFNDSQKKGILYMIICAALWSTAGIFIKLLPWNSMVIAGTRSLVAAVFYYLYMRHEKIPFVFSKYSISGGISLAFVFLLFVSANKLTTSANAIVLQYSAPIYILILSALLYRQKFRAVDIMAVVATTIGISLFFFDELSGGDLLGNILAIGSGVFFAVMFMTTGRAD